MRSLAAIVVLSIATACHAGGPDDESRPDIVVANFESSLSNDWLVEGDAFEFCPARPPLTRHREVTGYVGQGVATSCSPDNRGTGTLTSPSFALQRPHLNFLVGGGREWRKLRVELLVDGKVVAKTTPRYNSTAMIQQSWDVSRWAGQSARFRVVDDLSGGWGYLVVDHFVLSDRSLAPKTEQRRIVVDKRFLHLPIDTAAPMHPVEIRVGDEVIRKFDAALSPADEANVTTFTDLEDYRGQAVTVSVGPTQRPGAKLNALSFADEIPDRSDLYREPTRPQFHFTPPIGWMNDPNGMVFHGGKWHLYYQHNPYGTVWANMHWGHSWSNDLLHWRTGPVAVHPHIEISGRAYSGSGFIVGDEYPQLSSVFADAEPDALWIALTNRGYGETVAYSNDGGERFEFPIDEPQVVHPVDGRDPKILFHKPTGRWIMSVYERRQNDPVVDSVTFHSSSNLKDWTRESSMDGYYECPDLFEMPLDGDPNQTYWVVHAADARYQVGQFDGKAFTPIDEGPRPIWFGKCGAGQSFSHAPDGRRIQVQWGRVGFPGQRWNQQMTFPVELTLRTLDDRPTLCIAPVEEIRSLHNRVQTFENRIVAPGQSLVCESESGELDVALRVRVGDAAGFTIRLGGTEVVWSADGVIRVDGEQPTTLRGHAKVTYPAIDGVVSWRFLVDRASVEIFAGDGRFAVFHPRQTKGTGGPDSVTVHGDGGIVVESLEVRTLRGVWGDDSIEM